MDAQNGSPEQRKSWLQEDIRQLSEKVKAYELGADFEPTEEGAELTAAQLWAKLLSGSIHTRQSIIGQAVRNADLARDCFTLNHQGRLRNLEFELQDAREQLSAALAFEEPQSLHALIVAVQALRSVMVDGIASRPTVQFTATGPDIETDAFPTEAGVAERITEQLKTAGIDTQSICGYDWQDPGGRCSNSDAGDGVHHCTKVNPLHADAHACPCFAMLTHEEAEKLEAAK